MSNFIERQVAINAVGLNTWAGSRISKLPIVDAIPTEWIRGWAARTIKFTDINKRSVFRDTISLLLMDWEAAKRGMKSANDEWVEMVETMMEAEHKREEEKEE